MAKTKDAPSDRMFSHFRAEEATIVDVNRKTWTVAVETRHSAKTVYDIQVLSPYTHYANGEGIHHLPEVGATCYLAWPSDDTPPFVLGYKGAAGVRRSPDSGPERTSTAEEGGSDNEVSFQARRPSLNPGDIAFTGRDENFIILRRGGVIQVGSTPISQRIYIPVLNYIKDFCENYEMHAFGGDVAWSVSRQEDDPSGNAPASYVFHMNANAQDAKATVRVKYMALSEGSGDRTAWEVQISPQGIDRDTGDVSNPVYTLKITTGGGYSEVIGASRTLLIQGDDKVTVNGGRTVTVEQDERCTVGGAMSYQSSEDASFGGRTVRMGSEAAANPGVKGDTLVEVLASAVYVLNPTTGTATMSPASVAQLQRVLSRKVFLE